MALNFPDSPTLNQVYTDTTSGFSYQWNGSVWISYAAASTGNIRIIDDISASFNGSTQTFALASGGTAITPPNPQSVVVNLGGVVQDPSDDYTVSGSNIIFSTAPASGLSFSGVVLGVAVPVGVSTGDAYFRQVYSPVGVQTTFTFVNGYGVGYLDVYHNGAKLVPTADYTATDGVNFSLITAAQAGDSVEAVGYRVTSVAITNGSVSALNVSGNAVIVGLTTLNSNLAITSGGANITGVVTATGFVGDGSGLTGVGIGSTGNVNTSGIITASAFVGDGSGLTNLPSSEFSDGFIPEDQKLISIDTTLNNNQSNISFAEDLVIGTGVTFTVSTGTTVRMDALNVINASVVSASEDLDIPNGTTAQRPSSPTAGSIRYNTTTSSLEYYNGSQWVSVSNLLGTSLSGDIGIFGGGYTVDQAASSQIDYVTISTTGNASVFGTLTDSRRELGSCSNSTRGIFAGGDSYYLVPATRDNATIDSVNFSSTGSAFGFGNLSRRRSQLQGLANSTRGVFGGGYETPVTVNTIEYITIANSGDVALFGNFVGGVRNRLSACSSSTRGIFGGGSTPTNVNTIDYITIASTGNSIDFGDLTVTRRELAACSSSTRGVFGGGFPGTPSMSNVIDYITIATTGNATDFGDLTIGRSQLAACSSSTRGVFGGGSPSGNTIDYITISTTGNATDFGDLVTPRSRLSAASNSHGGLS